MPAPMSARRLRTRTQLLDAAAMHAEITRTDLERSTGLSRSAVAAGVSSLLAEGLLVERAAPRTAGRPGRPSTVLAQARPDGVVLGIDLGHGHVAVAVADTAGAVLAEQRQAVDVDGNAGEALDAADGLARTLLAEADRDLADVLAIAAGVPGPLDVRSGVVRSPTILSAWVGRAPGLDLAARFGRPVRVANDADVGALGELHFGAARGCQYVVYVKASDGVGAGLVLNGAVYRGASGISGEIGHTLLPGATDWCRCGNRGCLETVVSIGELRRQLSHVGLLPDTGATRPGPEPSLPELSLAELCGDPVAARIVTQAGRTLGRVLADLCNAINPALVVLGGEIGTAGRPLVVGVRESIDRYAQPATAASVTVRAAELGTRAEVMGAVALAVSTTTVPA